MTDRRAGTGRQGASKVGVVVAVLCAIVIGAVVFVALLPGIAPRRGADIRALKNEVQVKQVHQAMLVFANNTNGMLPVPGLIDRLPDPSLGQDIPGSGPEDELQNTTANLYSALIAQQYFNPDLLISPLERNPAVVEDDDYDLGAWQPENDQYWDPAFVADLATGSNVSFGHAPLAGADRAKWWSSDAPFETAHVGNRGPVDGMASSDSLSCRADGSWVGAIVRADNFTWDTKVEEGSRIRFGEEPDRDQRDNPFAHDPLVGEGDAFIAFTRRVTEAGPEFQHD